MTDEAPRVRKRRSITKHSEEGVRKPVRKRKQRVNEITNVPKSKLAGTVFDQFETGPIGADWIACGGMRLKPAGYVITDPDGSRMAYQCISPNVRKFIGRYKSFQAAYRALSAPKVRKRTRAKSG